MDMSICAEECFLKYYLSSVWWYKISLFVADYSPSLVIYTMNDMSVCALILDNSWCTVDAEGTGNELGVSWFQKPSTLCQYLIKGSTCAYPQETQEPVSIIWEDHHKLAQTAKAEAICLMEKNPVLKTSLERLGCALRAIPHLNKFECEQDPFTKLWLRNMDWHCWSPCWLQE